jgi:Holliday junction resolvase
MGEPFPDALEEVRLISQASERGREFEKFVAKLFGSLNFQVIYNARAARPRQVDLIATRGIEKYLIECKWRDRKADIDDLDGLRARLRRTAGAYGLLVSFHGFTGSVLSDVTLNSRQPVLLISGEELTQLVHRPEGLLRLLRRKTDALLHDGEVLLDEPVPTRRRSGRGRAAMPATKTQFRFLDGTRSTMLECAGGFGQFVFAREFPDVDWVPAAGFGVTLDIDPQIGDQEALIDVMEKLAGMGWATEHACWSIRQAARNWHGFGLADFVAAVLQWTERASSHGAHHTEEFCYLDRCVGGFYTLTADLGAHPTRRTTAANLSFQLPGIPLDTAPFMQLCRAIGAMDPAHFRPRATKSVMRHRYPHQQVRIGQPVALLVEPNPMPDHPVSEWVTGLVVPNPYRAGAECADEGQAEDFGRLVAQSEYAICALRQHHPINDPPSAYHLDQVESAWSTDAMICGLMADWAEEATADRTGRPERPPAFASDAVTVAPEI